MPHAAIPFRPHHRFAVPLPRSRRGGLVTRRFLAESRNISFPRRCGGSGERSEPIGALMPHAALWVVQRRICLYLLNRLRVSMPHAALWVVQQRCPVAFLQKHHRFNAARGFVGGATTFPKKGSKAIPMFQCRTRLCGWCNQGKKRKVERKPWFQCRTQLCGWCNDLRQNSLNEILCFNAARGFVGGTAFMG